MRETLWSMFRVLTLATFFAALSGIASSQVLGVLHIKVTLTDAARARMPVPRHALLISDNPPTSSPRRVVVSPDGTVVVRLRPGSYIVESDEPVAFEGKAYWWMQIVEVTAERDVVLELTAENADVGVAPAPLSSPASQENDPTLLLPQWKDSIVAVWTPNSRASGFVVDAGGLVVTSQRVIGSATAVDVQLTPSVKVGARVLVANRVRDVAVLWIDPETAASVRPVPIDCADGSKRALADGQKVVTIGAPLRGQKDVSFGEVVRVEPRVSVADFRLTPGSNGGPVFSTAGDVVGISSVMDDQDESRRGAARIVPVDAVCEVLRSAEKAMKSAERPGATRLPVEPLPFRAGALEAAAQRRPGDLSSYRMTSSDFDIIFLTPVLVQAAQHTTQQGKQVAATDFGGWSDYFADVPPGPRGSRHAKADRKLLDESCPRRRIYTGRRLTADQAFQAGVFAASRLVRQCRSAAHSPVHPRDARVRDRRHSRRPVHLRSPGVRAALHVRHALAGPEKDPGKQDTGRSSRR